VDVTLTAGQEAQDGPGEGGLAGTALPGDAKGFARGHPEAEIPQDPASTALDPEAIDLEEFSG